MTKKDNGENDLAITQIKQAIAEVRATSRAVDSAEGLEDIHQLPYIVPEWLAIIERDLTSALIALNCETKNHKK